MTLFWIATGLILVVQALTLLEGLRHIRFTLRKIRPHWGRYQPRVALFAPCKGLDDTGFDENIRSFLAQDYPDYEVFFTVESIDDPAYGRLWELIHEHRRNRPNGPQAFVVVAGKALVRGSKVHNLLAAVKAAPAEAEVFAFVDSDARLKPHFLSALIHPLRRAQIGASTGYRWMVPADGGLASRVLSALNAAVASLLGPHQWNSAWGGATGIRRQVFEAADVAGAWHYAASDDYVLTHAVKQAGYTVEFAPACFVASYVTATWGELFHFARRQFILTWACMRRLWWLALAGWGHTMLAFWGGWAFVAVLASRGSEHAAGAAVLPLSVWAVGTFKAAARQLLIRRILPEQRDRLRSSALLDVFAWPAVWLVGLTCLLASAGRRTIVWRGITYRLIDVHRAEICRPAVSDNTAAAASPEAPEASPGT